GLFRRARHYCVHKVLMERVSCLFLFAGGGELFLSLPPCASGPARVAAHGCKKHAPNGCRHPFVPSSRARSSITRRDLITCTSRARKCSRVLHLPARY